MVTTAARSAFASAFGRTCTLVLARDATAHDLATAMSQELARRAGPQLFMPGGPDDDLFFRPMALRLLDDAGENLPAATDVSSADLAERLLHLVHTGWLLAILEEPPRHDHAPQPAAPRPEVLVAAAAAVTEARGAHAWLEIEVVDDAGEPCTGATVRVLHDGAVVASGKVAAAPLIRFDGLPEADRYDVVVEPPRPTV